MIHDSISGCIGHIPLVSLKRLFARDDFEVIAGLGYLNPSGSIKDNCARYFFERGLRDGIITPQSHLIESSSGNLGIALAMLARVHSLPFTCVVDPKISTANLSILRNYGANIDMVTEQDEYGSYLHVRVQRVKELCALVPNALWMNQYANPASWQAHYYGTGAAILSSLDRPIDTLAIGVSTTGTLVGVARRLRESFPDLRVVAVDAVGSVIFGGPGGARELPGIGSTRVPEILDRTLVDDVVYISDAESIAACRRLVACEGIMAGASSGAAVAAIEKMCTCPPPDLSGTTRPHRILTIFPDFGDRYLDTVYV